MVKIIFNNIGKALFSIIKKNAKDTHVIDMWEMGQKSHIFGFWYNADDAYSDRKPPLAKIEFKIMPNGNYEYDPSPEQFGEFLKWSRVSIERFTMKNYLTFMLSKTKGVGKVLENATRSI